MEVFINNGLTDPINIVEDVNLYPQPSVQDSVSLVYNTEKKISNFDIAVKRIVDVVSDLGLEVFNRAVRIVFPKNPYNQTLARIIVVLGIPSIPMKVFFLDEEDLKKAIPVSIVINLALKNPVYKDI